MWLRGVEIQSLGVSRSREGSETTIEQSLDGAAILADVVPWACQVSALFAVRFHLLVTQAIGPQPRGPIKDVDDVVQGFMLAAYDSIRLQCGRLAA